MAKKKGNKKGRGKDRGQRIIANMGLFWTRDQVRWKGHRGIGRRLAGERRSAKRKGEVDFWKQTGVYALYTDDYHLVYVGQAGLTDKSCIGNRLKNHLTDDLAGRWNLFSWFGLKPAKGNTLISRKKFAQTRQSHLANVLEGIIIEVAEPPMNSQKGRFGKRVERFIQVDDSAQSEKKADTTMIAKIKRLEKQLSETKKQLTQLVRQSSSRTRKQLAKAIKRVSK